MGFWWTDDKIKIQKGVTTRNKPTSYAKPSWYNKVCELLSEYDDYYVFGYIPTGEMSDFRPRKQIAYKSLAYVKNMALEYIDREIEHLQKIKEEFLQEN